MSSSRLIFERQLGHVVWLIALLAALFGLSRLDRFFDGELWGIPTVTWVWASVVVPIVHQVYVWFCWRAELHAGLLGRWFGRAAFPLYAVIFSGLILARPVLITCLAVSNRGTAPGDPGFMRGLALLLTLLALYALYSVARYFGFKRAFGIDHFDPAYRDLPLVREGMFRYSQNAMYDFAFLLIWVPPLYYQSLAGLSVAGFSHLYIWVHYEFTEKPDMQRIYGLTDPSTAAGPSDRDR
jgi:hypothetical protein